MRPSRDGMNAEELNEVVVRNSMAQLRIQEVQLLLSEKRTSLSTLRTGITLLALPLSVVSFLVATSQLWSIFDVLYLMAPLLALCTTLVGIGSYLVMRALLNVQAFDGKIRRLSEDDDRLRDLVRIDEAKLLGRRRLPRVRGDS